MINSVSQIFIHDGLDKMPPALERAVSSVRGCFPSCLYSLYDKTTLREFISKNYESETLWAFDRLKPYAYKADLGKYCILYKQGGWYFDISINCRGGLNLPHDIEAVLFRDIQQNSLTSWSVSAGVIYSKPGNAIFRTAIDLVIKNCKQEYYGITPLCPTGPTLFGQAVASLGSAPKVICGDYIYLTPGYHKKNNAFVLPDGEIFAWGKREGGGDLAALGATGVNNYNELWRSRHVYEK